MPNSEGFKDYITGQLAGLPHITMRNMFGGTGIYSDGLFFALIADDTLYLKVDDSNRSFFVAEGMDAFRPYDDERTMNYYEVPVDVVEDADALAVWAARSVEITRRKPRRKKKRG